MRRGYLMGAKFGSKNCRADVFEKTSLRDDIANVRNVVKSYCLRREQSGRHARQCRILSSAYGHSAMKRTSARYTKFVHGVRQIKGKSGKDKGGQGRRGEENPHTT